MYKKQLTLQKILCFLALVSSVVIFLYALGIMTDLYDTLYSTMRNPADLNQTDVPGSIVYYNMQGWNGYFLHWSIALILLACLLFITNTELFKVRWQQVDFEALRAHADLWKTAYTESTFWFDIHYAVFALSVIVSVGLIVCAIWKVRLMKEEKQLIAAGKGATA